jgi:hypothetical protein
MQIIRRLYLYAVAIVSLEVVLWGVIGLARLILAGQEIGSDAGALAGALSLILVGVPVFLLHWWLAQRAAIGDIDERSSRVRAVFLYGGLLAVLVPAAQNTLAALSRSLVVLFGGRPDMALVGGGQSLSDNLVAIVLNLLVAVYLYRVLGEDWQASLQGDGFADFRRIYRYAWMLYGLAMLVFGVEQTLEYLLGLSQTFGSGSQAVLANALALLVVGVPLWWSGWSSIERSLALKEEANSNLRLVVLYVLSFAGAGVVLAAAGLAITQLLRVALGEATTLPLFLGRVSRPLSLAIPFGVMWAYYGRDLAVWMRPGSSSRAPSLRRLYDYILSLAGLAASITGLQQLLAFIIDISLGRMLIISGGLRSNLAGALAALLVGLPLWIYAWRPMAIEATQDGETGDHARRSPLRKGYLYLVLFSAVIGLMASAGALLFELISSMLGDAPENLLTDSLHLVVLLVLFALLLAYHGQALRADTRLAARALARRHAQYPVLVLAPDQGEFAVAIVEALQREVVELPIAVHPFSQGAPDETLSAAEAVILPAELVARPSEALRVWLQGFPGKRLVVPTSSPGWHWVSGSGRRLNNLAKQIARDVRQLAEGQELNTPVDTPPWLVFVYILAVLFGLQALLGLAGLVISLVQ